MESCLYEGRVTHVRHAPPHRLRMRLFALYLDLDELRRGFDVGPLFSTRRPAPFRVRREDYPGEREVPLDTAVRDLVERSSGVRPVGPIRLLTQPRTFGYGFNPVSFFYCFDAGGRRLDAVVAHVSNTPWSERHCYVLSTEGAPAQTFRARHEKRFHVSPFLPMDLTHEFTLSVPAERLSVRIADERAGQRVFEAAMTMIRRPLTSNTLARALLRYPFLSIQVVGRIYWNALRLHLKRAPFFPHPDPGAAARRPS
jgi:DUF1365 family protein